MTMLKPADLKFVYIRVHSWLIILNNFIRSTGADKIYLHYSLFTVHYSLLYVSVHKKHYRCNQPQCQ